MFHLQSRPLASERKEKFTEEIKTLTGLLKAYYDQSNKEYAGNAFHYITLPYSTNNNNYCLIFTFLILFLSFSDLPSNTPLTDLSKLADLDMSKLPKTEETGERCVRRIRNFSLTKCLVANAVCCRKINFNDSWSA